MAFVKVDQGSVESSSKTELTAELVRRLLDYNSETGELRWKARTPDLFEDDINRTAYDTCRLWNTRYAGRAAGHRASEGYLRLSIFNRRYLGSRLIWLIVTGKLPINLIDHRDGNQRNDRFDNLREATYSQNNTNRRPQIEGRLKGAVFYLPLNKWTSSICKDGKSKRLGYFDTEEEAHAAYCEAARTHHGEFARIA